MNIINIINIMNIIIYSIILRIILPIILLKQNKPRLCINCKFFIPDNNIGKFGKCSFFPKNNIKNNFLINGIYEEEYYHCITSRNINNMCGKKGKYYIKK
jgi:hypothetical protein